MFKKNLSEIDTLVVDSLIRDSREQRERNEADKQAREVSTNIFRALIRRDGRGDVIVIIGDSFAELKRITPDMEDGKYSIIFSHASQLCAICELDPRLYTFYLCVGTESEKTIQLMQTAYSNFFWATIGPLTYLAVANKEELK